MMLSSIVSNLTQWRRNNEGVQRPDPRHTFAEWLLRPGTQCGEGPSATEKKETEAIWEVVGAPLINLFSTVTGRCAGHTHTDTQSF